MKIPSNIRALSSAIFKRYGNQYKVVHIECSDFKNIPSDNDFMIHDPVKITRSNAVRIAGIMLTLSYFTHYASTKFLDK